MPEQISGNQFDTRLGIFSYHDLKTRTTISYYVGKGRLTRFARNQLQHTANGCCQTLNFFIVIIITRARLRRAAGKSDAVNRVRFYTFAGPWVISVSRPLGK